MYLVSFDVAWWPGVDNVSWIMLCKHRTGNDELRHQT